jgi:hypothetical protein
MRRIFLLVSAASVGLLGSCSARIDNGTPSIQFGGDSLSFELTTTNPGPCSPDLPEAAVDFSHIWLPGYGENDIPKIQELLGPKVVIQECLRTSVSKRGLAVSVIVSPEEMEEAQRVARAAQSSLGIGDTALDQMVRKSTYTRARQNAKYILEKAGYRVEDPIAQE